MKSSNETKKLKKINKNLQTQPRIHISFIQA